MPPPGRSPSCSPDPATLRAPGGPRCRSVAGADESLSHLIHDGRMDDSLYFTEHHRQVRETVREFAHSHIAPVAAELDRTSTFPWDNIKAMGELGLLGVPWSEELGGA